MLSPTIGSGYSNVILRGPKCPRPRPGANYVIRDKFCSLRLAALRRDTGRGAESASTRFRRCKPVVRTYATKPWSRWFGGEKDSEKIDNTTGEKSAESVSPGDSPTFPLVPKGHPQNACNSIHRRAITSFHSISFYILLSARHLPWNRG
jgi:hypothetical protein